MERGEYMKITCCFTGGTIGCVRKGEVLSPDNEQKYMLTRDVS